jgi:hypothetical protein
MKTMNFANFRALRFVMIIAASILISSCYSQKSFDDYAEKRRQTLLNMYPPRATTKKDVRAKWSVPPQVEASRPEGGWGSHPEWWIREYGSKAEKRIGRNIPKLERYFGADGIFSLCYCWFYYDSRDRLLDAEWQWSSD